MLHRSLPGGNSHHRQRHHSAQGARRRPVLRSPALAGAQDSRRRGLGVLLGQALAAAIMEEGPMDLKLKTISKSGIAEAIAKAELYRYLNEPEEAESICRDILVADPTHAFGQRMLGLAITDQFTGGPADRYAEVEGIFQSLADPYERQYYTGLLCERRVKAQLRA